MTEQVRLLLDFYATRNFGTRENLLARQREARETYRSLTPDEAAELAEAVLSQADAPDDGQSEGPLCCLACFRPGSLKPFHRRLVERRLLYPGVIFHGAGTDIAVALLRLLEEDEQRNLALLALAWVGDEAVVRAFAGWRESPPPWASTLFVPPESYAHEAGWELTPEGRRRDLFHETAYPLVRPDGAASPTDIVRVGVGTDDACPWCGRRLVGLLDFRDIGDLLPGQPGGPASVLTCDVCTCFGTVFAGDDGHGRTQWHRANERPDYLPPDTSDWDAFPASPLVLSGQPRHFLEAADWATLPGVGFSQVGGLPTWVQDAEYPACPDCDRTMPFVGQISNEDFVEFGEGLYYAFRCPECRTTATRYQQS